MHTAYFVIMDKGHAIDSEEAEQVAKEILNDQGFISSGYFGGGKADYFCVGGRLSGLFKELLIGVMLLEDHLSIPGENAMLITDELRMKLTSENESMRGDRSDIEYYDVDNFNEGDIKDIRSDFNDRRIVLFDYHH